MKYFFLLLSIMFFGCSSPSMKNNDENLKSKKIDSVNTYVAFASDFSNRHPSYLNNEITRERGDLDFQKELLKNKDVFKTPLKCHLIRSGICHGKNYVIFSIDDESLSDVRLNKYALDGFLSGYVSDSIVSNIKEDSLYSIKINPIEYVGKYDILDKFGFILEHVNLDANLRVSEGEYTMYFGLIFGDITIIGDNH